MSSINSGDNAKSRLASLPQYDEDDDVSFERQRVVLRETENDTLTIFRLSKNFRIGLKTFRAVKNLSLSIHRGECFGLLGVNGAGKSTTFRMITGDTLPTDGAVFVEGRSVTNNLPALQQQVGYCPQFDALDDLLTTEETLRVYGKIKGLEDGQLVEEIEAIIPKLGLEKFRHRTSGTYSGGTKRKLSTAVALLGDPLVVLMDEPTTGMDPGTRRLVWRNILDVVRDNRSVILTSHSMEECDVLCTRLSIMVNGELKCLGSPQHLKTKFSQGYTLEIRVDPSRGSSVSELADRILLAINVDFATAFVRDLHHNTISVTIGGADKRALGKKAALLDTPSLGAIFRTTERVKAQFAGVILDYSVAQTTLDQVFVSFVGSQTQLAQQPHLLDDDDDDADSVSALSWSEMEADVDWPEVLRFLVPFAQSSASPHTTDQSLSLVGRPGPDSLSDISLGQPTISRTSIAGSIESHATDRSLASVQLISESSSRDNVQSTSLSSVSVDYRSGRPVRATMSDSHLDAPPLPPRHRRPAPTDLHSI